MMVPLRPKPWLGGLEVWNLQDPPYFTENTGETLEIPNYQLKPLNPPVKPLLDIINQSPKL